MMDFFIKYPFNPISLLLYVTILVIGLTVVYIKYGKKRSLERFVLSPQFLVPVMIIAVLAAGFDAFLSFSEGKPERALLGILITISVVIYNYNFLKQNHSKK